MKFDDILTLAKGGYTPNQIKELMTLGEELQESTEEIQEEETQEEETITATEEEPEVEVKEEVTEEEPDYKKLYEDSQKALKKAQKDNVSKKVVGEETKSNSEILQDWARSFM